jgi:hypothetical protein
MPLCLHCRRLNLSPTALNAPETFELNRLLHVPAPERQALVAYRYYTCTSCGARWLQLQYEDDASVAWKMQR